MQRVVIRGTTFLFAFLAVYIAIRSVSQRVRAEREPEALPERIAQRLYRDDPEVRGVIEAYVTAHPELSTPSLARQAFQEISMRGMVRLDDAALIGRARRMAKGLSRLDSSTCAKWGSEDQVSPETVMGLYAAMDSVDVEWMARISARAMVAEIRDQPPPRIVSEAELEEIVAAIADLISEDATYELLYTLEDPTATEAELCSAIRDIFDLVTELPQHEAGLLARLLAMPE